MQNCWRVIDITEFLIQKLSAAFGTKSLLELGVDECDNLNFMNFKINSFKIRKIRILNLWLRSGIPQNCYSNTVVPRGGSRNPRTGGGESRDHRQHLIVCCHAVTRASPSNKNFIRFVDKNSHEDVTSSVNIRIIMISMMTNFFRRTVLRAI